VKAGGYAPRAKTTLFVAGNEANVREKRRAAQAGGDFSPMNEESP
jgi:hypothetical protein